MKRMFLASLQLSLFLAFAVFGLYFIVIEADRRGFYEVSEEYKAKLSNSAMEEAGREHLSHAISEEESKQLSSETSSVDSLSQNKATQREFEASSVALFALGQSQQNRGQLAQALASYRKVREQDPAYAPTYLREAEILYQLNQPDEAISILKSAEKIAGGTMQYELLLAVGYLEKSDLTSARKHLNLALASFSKKEAHNGNDAAYYVQLGGMVEYLYAGLEPLEMRRRVLAARPFYLKAEALEPKNPLIQIKLAELAALVNDRDQSLKAYKKAYEAAPDFPRLREKLASTFLLNHQTREAIPILEEIVQKDPTKQMIYPALGELYTEIREYAKAEDRYLLALRLNSPNQSNSQLYIRIALAQIAQNKYLEARSILLEADRKFHQDAKVAFLAALNARYLKKLEESILWFMRAERRGKGMDSSINSDFYAEYGATLEMKGDIQNAVRQLEKAIQLDSKNHKALNYIAYMWIEKGIELEKAARYLDQAMRLDPDNAAYEDSLGWLYYQKKEYAKAKKWIEKALKKAPDEPVINDHMGDIYLALNNPENALRYWQKAMDQKHDKPEDIRAKIQALRKEKEISHANK